MNNYSEYEQVRRIELPSPVWQTGALTIVLHLLVRIVELKDSACSLSLNQGLRPAHTTETETELVKKILEKFYEFKAEAKSCISYVLSKAIGTITE